MGIEDQVRSNAASRSADYDADAFELRNRYARDAIACLAMGSPEEAQVNATLALAFETWKAARL